MKPQLAAALSIAVAVLGTSSLGSAQSVPQPSPTPIVVPTLPPAPNAATSQIINAAAGIINGILTRDRINNANNAHGTVSYFKRFDMQLQTGPNSFRTIHLHQGTVINPRGATPNAGTTVEINGNGLPDGSIDANTITVDRY